MILIIKYKTICVFSSCKIQQNTGSFDANYRVKWCKLLYEVLDIELFLDTYHFTNYLNQRRR